MPAALEDGLFAAPELISSADVRLLTELGFCALGLGRIKAARSIFEGLRGVRSQRAFPYIGLAVTEIAARRFDQAVSVLQAAGEVIAEDRAEINTFLGLALQLAGRHRESVAALEAAVSQAGGIDTPVVLLARQMRGDHAVAPRQGMPF